MGDFLHDEIMVPQTQPGVCVFVQAVCVHVFVCQMSTALMYIKEAWFIMGRVGGGSDRVVSYSKCIQVIINGVCVCVCLHGCICISKKGRGLVTICIHMIHSHIL